MKTWRIDHRSSFCINLEFTFLAERGGVIQGRNLGPKFQLSVVRRWKLELGERGPGPNLPMATTADCCCPSLTLVPSVLSVRRSVNRWWRRGGCNLCFPQSQLRLSCSKSNHRALIAMQSIARDHNWQSCKVATPLSTITISLATKTTNAITKMRGRYYDSKRVRNLFSGMM